MEDKDHFDAFLSYASRPDRVVARRLEAWLERLHEFVPKENGLKALRVCRDGSDFRLSEEHSQQSGESAVQATLRHYLRKCRHLLVLCSSGSATSEHVDDEIRIFLENAPADDRPPGERIILAVTEGQDPSSKLEEVFPEIVREFGLHERIWADLRGVNFLRRRGAEGVRDYEEERLALAARLYRESVESISPYWYREQRRLARRRLVSLASVFLIVLALAGGLFFFWRASIENERETRDTLRMALAERHQTQDLELSAAYLREVERPEQTRRWFQRVQEHLRAPVADVMWGKERLAIVGGIYRHGNVVMAYSLAANWGIFPPGHATGCEVGFTGDPLGTPIVSPSQGIAFVQRNKQLFRFHVSCLKGDRDGERFDEPRPLVGVWGGLPIVAQSDLQLVVATPGEPGSQGMKWSLPFKCALASAPPIQERRLLLLCDSGSALSLGDQGRVEVLETPEGCRGEVNSASKFSSGILYSVSNSLCRLSLEQPAVQLVWSLTHPVTSLASSPEGTVAAVVDESGKTFRVWMESDQVEILKLAPEPLQIAVDEGGLVAAAWRGRLEWVSIDQRVRGSRSLPDVYVHDAIFLPNGRLVVALDDSTLRVWSGSRLRKALTLEAQLLHMRVESGNASGLFLVDDRLAIYNPAEGSLDLLREDLDWDETTEQTGWLKGACKESDPSRQCWFDAVDPENSAVIDEERPVHPLQTQLSLESTFRIEGAKNVLCELRTDGWTICDEADVRFRLPDREFTTPEGEVISQEPRTPEGIRRVDDNRFIVWATDRACLFQTGRPERCKLLGYSGGNIEAVETANGVVLLGTLDGYVNIYRLEDMESGNPVQRTSWELDQEVRQMRISGERLLIAHGSGISDIPFTHSALQAELSRHSGLCVGAGQRVLELGEALETAERRYQECRDRLF